YNEFIKKRSEYKKTYVTNKTTNSKSTKSKFSVQKGYKNISKPIDSKFSKTINQSQNSQQQKTGIYMSSFEYMPSDRQRLISIEYRQLQEYLEKKYFYTLTHHDLIKNRNSSTDDSQKKNFLTKLLQYDEAYSDNETFKKHKQNTPNSFSVGDLKVNPFKLYPNLSHLAPIIPDNQSKSSKISINLALPKDELLAYVGKIKDNYDRDNSAINLPFDHIVRNDNQHFYNFRSKLSKSSTNSKYNFPSRTQQQIYADLFFIYDVLSVEDTIRQSKRIKLIQNELLYYWADYILHHNHKDQDQYRIEIFDDIAIMDHKTISKRFSMLRDYIDNEKYRELIN
ncbi:MAG: hypothetical protein U9N34_07865, partial [Candidatus Cloacimonadota bacterium]|nr:hypothetical protein [Candidatus Cloacimonadota bacterium]